MPKTVKQILFFTIDFPPMGGGMSRHSFDVASALRECGESLRIVTPEIGRGRQDYAESGLEVHCLKNLKADKVFDSYKKSVLRFFAYGFGFCITHRVKAVLVNTWSVCGVAAFFLKKVLGVPYIVFAHGLDIYTPKKSKKAAWLMRLVLRKASLVIANSTFTANLLKDDVPKEKIIVLHPALDLTRFRQSGRCDTKRFEGKPVILTVARLVDSKGHETVIRALPIVIKQFPNLVYLIVGDGPLYPQLKGLAAELGLSERVIFEGNVSEAKLRDYFSCCEIFVMASKEIPDRGEVEGFGIVFLEAAACGKPVIATKSGGIPDAVVDGVTGILVEPDDPEALAQALIRLFLDKPLRDQLGKNALKRVEQDFNIERLGERLRQIVNNGLAKKT